VLLVDDEVELLQSLQMALRTGGISNVLTCQDSEKAVPLLANQQIEAMVLDLWMPGVSGEEILSVMAQDYPDVPVIILTGVNDVDTAVKCIKNGAFDYIVKPVEKARLLTAVDRAIQFRDLRRENALLKRGVLSADVKHPEAFAEMITSSREMTSIFRYVEAVAATSQPVLITGETGVGKELLARAIHAVSERTGAFVPVNVAGLDDSVFADTLFGHRKGAFTGAEVGRAGLIEQARGGTLLLDEIGDLTVSSQLKLLRLLQEREYLPLGSDLARRTDSRIVVATNEDLDRSLEAGRFRKDLYYRLRTHHIHIPPLRERPEDLPLLLEHFLRKASSVLGKKTPRPPQEVLALLEAHDFPGNVRELKSMVFDAVSNHDRGMLSMKLFKAAMGGAIAPRDIGGAGDSQDADSALEYPNRLPTLKEAERSLVSEALRRSRGNQSVAAQLLGISRQALNRRLNRGQS